MDLARKCFDFFYDVGKYPLFYFTKKDPEVSHELFIGFAKKLYSLGLDKFFLNNSYNENKLEFELSNAAGFNKNAEIPPSFLRYLGFDRVVVGTVTNNPCKGNKRPRIKRNIKTSSMINEIKLENAGSKKVAENLRKYKNNKVPLTISIMAHPNSKNKEILSDLKNTILDLRDVFYVDRFEVNVSCPNVEHNYSLESVFDIVCKSVYNNQELWVKVSPNLTKDESYSIIKIVEEYPIKGFTTTNTKSLEKGGGSGEMVYNDSLDLQKFFYKNSTKALIACGGIDSKKRRDERLKYGASGIQVFTPLVFRGPKLLRDLRK
jgi:dihydroorotate dehydrogenase